MSDISQWSLETIEDETYVVHASFAVLSLRSRSPSDRLATRCRYLPEVEVGASNFCGPPVPRRPEHERLSKTLSVVSE